MCNKNVKNRSKNNNIGYLYILLTSDLRMLFFRDSILVSKSGPFGSFGSFYEKKKIVNILIKLLFSALYVSNKFIAKMHFIVKTKINKKYIFKFINLNNLYKIFWILN